MVLRAKKIAFVIGIVASVVFAQIVQAHEIVAEDEILYLESIFPIPLKGKENHNWFDADADRHNGALQAMLEPLFFIDETTGELSGWLAEGADFLKNDTVVEIRIRDAAAWSDGTPFTAHDVVFSLGFPQGKPEFTAPHVRDVQNAVTGSEALTDKRVRITLNIADPLFLHRHFSAVNGGSYPIVPKHIWEGAVTPKEIADLPLLGTGPYEMVNSEPGHSVTWERIPWWGTENGWKPRPIPHRLVWHRFGSLESRTSNLVRGSRDVTEPVYSDLADSIDAITGRATTWMGSAQRDATQTCGYVAYLNPPKSNDPLEMRKALLALVDRGRLARQILTPAMTPADSHLPRNGLTKIVRKRLEGRGKLLPPNASVVKAHAAFTALGCSTTPSQAAALERRGGGVILCPDIGMEPPAVTSVTFPVHHLDNDLTAMAIARELSSGYQSFRLVAPVKALNAKSFSTGLNSGAPGLFIYPIACSDTREPILTLSRFLQPPKPVEGDPAKELEAALGELRTAYDPGKFTDAYVAAADAFTAVPLVDLGETIPAATHFWEGWQNVPLDQGTWSQRTHLLWTRLKPPKSDF